jgi:hypothetical protein
VREKESDREREVRGGRSEPENSSSGGVGFGDEIFGCGSVREQRRQEREIGVTGSGGSAMNSRFSTSSILVIFLFSFCFVIV